MDKTKTAVIIGIVTVILLGVVIYLNRDKFGSQKSDDKSEQVAPAKE